MAAAAGLIGTPWASSSVRSASTCFVCFEGLPATPVIQTFNEEAGKRCRVTGGDLATGYINLGDYYDYPKGSDDPYLATMELRPRDSDGFLFTADIYAGNYPTRRATPFAKSRSGHVCLDFQRTGEVLKRKLDLATYHC
ncbi:MAG TPA: hypothetical protein VFT86_00560 [Gaiellaceae bacterium]|nr:hypothetical protein [Gaiellaceae bacterium]